MSFSNHAFRIAKWLINLNNMASWHVTEQAVLDALFQRIRENYKSTRLIRVGGDNDGGYLLPDVFANVSHCFSPGVSDTANFEHEISEAHGIISFMADASVSDVPLKNDNFHFIKKFLGNRTHGEFITLKDWMDQSLDGSERGLILQMDIEGAEYDVLGLESAETLGRFKAIIVEFHGLQLLVNPTFARNFGTVLEKLFQNFVICHVHSNNAGSSHDAFGLAGPNVVEVTFLHREELNNYKSDEPLAIPHPLDQRNDPSLPDIELPDIWWRAPI